MKRFRRMLCLILVLVMLLTMFPTMRLTPAVHAEWGDGESCFVCDGYLDENNCCQGCGGVHAEDVNSDCYNAMHCKDCGECFLLVSGCAKCGRCEDSLRLPLRRLRRLLLRRPGQLLRDLRPVRELRGE